MISENARNTLSALLLHLRMVFFSSDFIKLCFVKCLKILQNKVENACEISFLCDCYSYDYRGSATISSWGLEEKNWHFHSSLIDKTDVTWTLLYIFLQKPHWNTSWKKVMGHDFHTNRINVIFVWCLILFSLVEIRSHFYVEQWQLSVKAQHILFDSELLKIQLVLPPSVLQAAQIAS